MPFLSRIFNRIHSLLLYFSRPVWLGADVIEVQLGERGVEYVAVDSWYDREGRVSVRSDINSQVVRVHRKDRRARLAYLPFGAKAYELTKITYI